jgi:hypothetical protein
LSLAILCLALPAVAFGTAEVLTQGHSLDAWLFCASDAGGADALGLFHPQSVMMNPPCPRLQELTLQLLHVFFLTQQFGVLLCLLLLGAVMALLLLTHQLLVRLFLTVEPLVLHRVHHHTGEA